MRSLRSLLAPRDDRVWDIATGFLANTLAMTTENGPYGPPHDGIGHCEDPSMRC